MTSEVRAAPRRGSPRWWRQHPRAADTAVCAAFALCALLTVALFTIPAVIWYNYPPGSPMANRVTVLGVVVAVAGTAMLRWRRRFPVPVALGFAVLALVSLLLTAGSGVTTIGLALATYAVAASRSSITAWTLAIATWAVLSVAHWNLLSVTYLDLMGLGWLQTRPGHLQNPPGGLTPEQWTGTELAPVTSDPVKVTAVVTIAALLLLAVALGTNARLRRQREDAQRERERTLRREEQQNALLARVTERTHIAREVHDVIAHSVSVMVALADGAGAVAATSPEEARVAMREVSQTGRAALADMKRVLLALDDAPAATGDDEDLATMVSRFRLAGLPVTATGLDTALPEAAIALAARRILAESLTNVLRHAPGADEVSVAVGHSEEVVTIEVTNGAGGDTTAVEKLGAGRGLTGMRERAELLGGTVDAGPVPGGGWRVAATLPARAPRSEPAERAEPAVAAQGGHA
ncbi:sensor histidine kinase [Pseudactinotalea suaedae]|uniref:sensor histidine kinase n=1 Tax=Pseudactinotalea suaedae TaxID=1524924 RepID=UPI0012E2DDF2|nr:histidine kinase [Pseudactinotalea suaedae]